MSPYMKTIREHLCWRKLCLHTQFSPQSKYYAIKTIWFCEEIFKRDVQSQDWHCQTIGWHLYKRSHTFRFWISPKKIMGGNSPDPSLFKCTSSSLKRECRTRSWGPGYIVGFMRVKVLSVRSILYSTTWWVKDCGTYHGWLNQGLDCDTIHHKLVGERFEQMSSDKNVL